MSTLAALLLAAVVSAERNDADAARADYETRVTAGNRESVYVTYATAPAEQREDLRAALRLMVASTSRQPVVERCVPEPLGETLSRLDLGLLRWKSEDWVNLTRDYPYHHYLRFRAGGQVFVRADWLLLQLADLNESDAYYRFLLGKVPKTRDEFLEAFGIDRGADDFLRWGQVEAKSGVAVNRTRWLESFPASRGYAWGTRDSLEITPEKDPLEHLLGDFDHDGEEWILGIPKLSLSARRRGVLQVYFLSDGDGNLVNEAPVDLVEDSTRSRGNANIINPVSCVQCHAEGLNPTKVNALAEYRKSGAELYSTDPDTLARIEAFHLGDLSAEIAAANVQYGLIVQAVTGLDAKEAAAAFKRSIDRYDADLTLADVAREVGRPESEVRNAIAFRATKNESISARIASLAHEGAITREALEDQFRVVSRYVYQWNLTGKPKP